MKKKVQSLTQQWFREPVREINSAPASDVDPQLAAAVVDLALRAAEMAVQTGAVTSDATSFALTITTAYGLSADVDVTFTSVTISYHRRGKAEPITGFRGVRQRYTNYTQLTQLLRLIDDIGTGRVGLEAARDRLDALRSHSRPYRIWVITLPTASNCPAAGTRQQWPCWRSCAATSPSTVTSPRPQGNCRSG